MTTLRVGLLGAALTLFLLWLTLRGSARNGLTNPPMETVRASGNGLTNVKPTGPSDLIRGLERQSKEQVARDRQKSALEVERLFRINRGDGGVDGGGMTER